MRSTRPLAVAVLLLAALATPARADVVTPSPGTHAFTTADALVPVLDGPDGTHQATIDTRLYVPDDATAATPQPAVLMTHGFGLSKTSAEVVSSATFLARHGYVVLTYTAQGFGASSGCVTLQSRTYDVKDAQQLITKVLETKPYVRRDAKGAVVGTVGGSYGGGIQANLAEADPRVRAIVPGRTWSSLQYSLDPNNYVVPGDPTGFTHTLNPQGVFKAEWTSLFYASGNANPVGGIPPSGTPAGGCPQEKLASPDPAGLPCPGYQLELCETYTRIAATGDGSDADRALLADSSGTTDIGRLRVPTLLVQGQSDTLFNLNDAVATYTQLRRQHVPVQMIWNSGGHGGYDSLPGECEVYGGGTGGPDYRGLDSCYLTLRTLAFLDHWLRGRPDRSPGFSWYRDWAPTSGNGPSTSYGDAPAFPLPGTTTWALSGSSLVTGAATAGTTAIVNPAGAVPAAYTETSNFTGPASSPQVPLPPTEVPGQHADFTSTPFARTTDAVGVPSLHVTLSHTAPTDLVVYGKVYDVAPDGTATLIHRLIAPARIPSAALSAPVDLKLLGFAHRFAAGHRVRLTLATTDATSYGNKVADVITVHSGPGTRFVLPTQVVPASAVAPTVVHVRPPSAAAPARTLASTGPGRTVPAVALLLLAGGAWVRRRSHA
ncbi:MAG: CocE/NonD family hydrolase [Mycobacteriales bacterium]